MKEKRLYTSGNIVRSLDIPIKVVDELPACTEEEIGSNPALPGFVNITRVRYNTSKEELEVRAESGGDVTLWVVESATNSVIGTLELQGGGPHVFEYRGTLSWPVNPQNIKVINSPLGGWNEEAVD